MNKTSSAYIFNSGVSKFGYNDTVLKIVVSWRT